MRVSVSGGAHVSTGTERRTSGATDGDAGADEGGATNTVERSVVADEPSVDIHSAAGLNAFCGTEKDSAATCFGTCWEAATERFG